MHHRSGKKGIHHRASDPEKEKKEGFHGGGVYFFLPCKGLLSANPFTILLKVPEHEHETQP